MFCFGLWSFESKQGYGKGAEKNKKTENGERALSTSSGAFRFLGYSNILFFSRICPPFVNSIAQHHDFVKLLLVKNFVFLAKCARV